MYASELPNKEASRALTAILDIFLIFGLPRVHRLQR